MLSTRKSGRRGAAAEKMLHLPKDVEAYARFALFDVRDLFAVCFLQAI